MKQILKSLLVLAIVVATTAGATGAYFTSNVIAADNEIVAGTLLLAVDTAQNESYNPVWNSQAGAWNVVGDTINGVVVGQPFITWDNAAPGEENSYYVGIRNRGTIPMNVRAQATGRWVSGPRFGNPSFPSCPATASGANHALVSVAEVKLFAATPTTGCDSEFGCRNIRDSLIGLGGGWAPVAGLTAGSVAAPTGMFYGNTNGSTNSSAQGDLLALGAQEFVIYRVDAELSPATDNCYQGATYTFDLAVDGKQVNGTW